MKNTRIAASLVVLLVVLSTGAKATEVPFVDAENTRRFSLLDAFQGQAVFDHTTRLIWERSPLATEVTWTTATTRCALKTVGGRTGWRLPSFIELMTLVEPSPQQTAILPSLPPNHPFQGVKAGAYWTTDAPSSDPGQAYTVDLFHADVSPRYKNQIHPLWCVQGGITDSTPPSSPTTRPGLI